MNLPIAAFALDMMAGELKSQDTPLLRVNWLGLGLMVTAIGAL